MPGAMLNADTSFPQFTNETNAEKIEKIQSYLFMLLENLRYSFANLGRDNFNSAEFSAISEIITEPVYMQLSDAEGRLSTMLSVTAEGLSSRIENAEGDVSTLQQTADALSNRITDAEGNISAVTQTASILETRLYGKNGDVSSLRQTVEGFTLSVETAGKVSTITLSSNGAQISGGKIDFRGMVTFSNLRESGSTEINGDNIKTGTISAISVDSCSITGSTITGGTINGSTINGSTFRTTLDAYGTKGGEIKMFYNTGITEYLAGYINLEYSNIETEDWSKYRLFIRTTGSGGRDFALKLESAGGTSITSHKNIYMEAKAGMTVNVTGDLTFRVTGNLNFEVTGSAAINRKQIQTV